MHYQFRRATAAAIRISLATAQVMATITATNLLSSPNTTNSAFARAPERVFLLRYDCT